MNCECQSELLCMPHRMAWDLQSIEAELRNRGEHDLAEELSTITVQLTDQLGEDYGNKRPIIPEQVPQGA